MRSVYEHASQSIIWLGVSNDESDLAMDLIKGREFFDFPDRPQKMRGFILDNRVGVHNIGTTDEESAALFKLLSRPWWSRIWCLQEVAVASQDPLITCGHKSVSWSDYATITKEITADMPYPLGIWQQAAIQQVRGTCDFVLVRDHVQMNSLKMSLSSLLKRAVNLNATDPRDNVYALLGITHEEDRQALLPDYSKSPS
jgi:hypothetical protein